jgi:hypothetical protein
MTMIKTNAETIRVPMMTGNAALVDVLSFDCQGLRLSARQVNSRMCYILHRATGLKITAEWTGDIKEAIEGFSDAVNLGHWDLTQIVKAAASFQPINQ